MGLFNRFFNKPLKPSVSKRPSGLSGPITLHEALAVALPAATEIDAKARLVFITSGLDMQPDGRSRTWEFIFVLPDRIATVMLSLEPDIQLEDPDEASTILTKRVNPASSNDMKCPSLPTQTRNSPEVVSEFSSKGVDFVAGPTDMKIESRTLPSGDIVWVTYYFDQELTTRFELDKS
jgi:hypothetical protein